MLALLLTCSAVRAQVRVEVLTRQEQFLPGESLVVSVRVINRSGQTLSLGRGEDWLSFAVQSREGRVVQKLSDPDIIDEFTLESGQMGTKHVDISPHFALSTPSRYQVVATVRIPELGTDVSSLPRFFDIIEGSRLWEQEVGLPGNASTATNGSPVLRRFTLQQANYLRGQIRLYLRVSNPETGKVIKLVPIGSMVSFSRPEPQIDRDSHLHVLYQNGPHTFIYSVFSTEGELILRRTYDYVDSRPRLRPDATGNVVVLGGVVRPSATDFPGESDKPVPIENPAKPPPPEPLSPANPGKP